MVGKCIRKKDRSEFDYMMKVKKSIPVFYLNSGTWQYIGLQKDFENKFEFKDPINVSIILFCLESIMITDVLKNHLVKKVNSKDDQKEKNIAGWLCKRFGKVDVLCIQDLETFDISGVPHISKSFKPDKKFVFKHTYQGFRLGERLFLLIGEKITWNDVIFQSVNGKNIDTFHQNSQIENFNDYFYLMQSGEDAEKAWKSYQAKETAKKFDM